MAWNDGLRDGQRACAGAPRQHLVILAGPGTGKTFVLVRRIQYLVEELTVSPKRILALAFTRAAAAEMRSRLEDTLADTGTRIRVSTLHSYALSELLRQGAQQLPAPVRVAGDWEERRVVVEELARLLERMVLQISNSKGTGALDLLADDWDTLAADGEGWESGHADPQFLTAWRRHREVYGYTLRSELVYQLLCELRSNPDFSPASPFEVVLVDEYQDLNRCELDATRFLVQRSGAELLAAGDDDQSIYLFRHAHPTGIRTFTSSYPANQLQMTECLRCGPEIVEIANWLITQEHNRVPKELVSVTTWSASVRLIKFRDQTDEASSVARIVQREIAAGTPAHEILILMKSDTAGRISGAVRSALQDRGLRAYLPRAQRDPDNSLQMLLEYLILSEVLDENSDIVDDLALRALLELEDNSIGETRIARIVDYAYQEGMRFSAAIEAAKDLPGQFAPGTYRPLFEAVESIRERAFQMAQRDDEEFDAWLLRVCEDLNLPEDSVELVISATHQIESDSEQQPEESAPVDGEGQVETQQQQRERRNFVQDLLVAMTGLSDTLPATMPDHVTITTMHGAKGLSADIVVLLQAEDEVIPDELTGPEFDEARRLLYVSLTRAKKKLLITACDRRTGPQRFIGQQVVSRRTLTQFLRDYGLVAQRPHEYLSATSLAT